MNPHRDEQGAVAIIAGISLLTMLLMAAFVLDLAALRSDRTTSQSIGDMAATAAAVEYGSSSNYEQACREALAFAAANLRITGDDAAGRNAACATFAGHTCDDSTVERSATYDIGNYRITVTNPVVDGYFRMTQQAPDTTFDGEPCGRFGVEVERDRTLVFGGLAGVFDSSTQRGSVSLSSSGSEDGDPASLIVLRRDGCATLETGGQAQIIVDDLEREEDGVDVRYPGIITVDTVANGCNPNSNPVINTKGGPSAPSAIRAEDFLYSYGLTAGSPQPQVYDESNVAANKIAPRPTPGRQVTRSPVDYLFNCLDDYDAHSGDRWSPSHADSIGTIDACGEGNPGYVKALHGALSPRGAPVNQNKLNGTHVAIDALRSEGWSIFPDDFAGQSCGSASGTYGPGDDVSFGTGDRFYVNCGQNSNQFSPSGITFRDVDVVVHRNIIKLTGSAAYTVDGHPARGTVLFFQRGGVDFSGGTIDWTDVFTYIENGWFSQSGSGSVTWRTALGGAAGGCPASFPTQGPPAACFSPLALWSNAPSSSSNLNTMGGQAVLDVAGTFFTPNSVFDIGGQGNYALDEAQFFAAELHNSGQGELRMIPNPDTTIDIPFRRTGLIR